MRSIDYLVCVRCFTFNHASYIQDAMNGFCMQKTNFPYVCVIVDDASTDGEPDVIKEYLQTYFDLSNKSIVRNEETNDYLMTYAQHITNKNCFFAVYFLKYNHYSIKKDKFPYLSEFHDTARYVALCEGDDYWIDSKKLQLQADFMNSHPEYGLCYTKVQRFIQNSKKFKERDWGGPFDSFDDLMKENTIPTLTSFYRVQAKNKYLEEIRPSEKKWKMGDYPQWLWFAHEYKVKFIPVVTGVYRILEESASHSQDHQRDEEFVRSTYAMKSFFINYYDRHDLERDNDLYLLLFKFAIRTGQRKFAISLFPKIKSPTLKIRMKYYIARIPILYQICKGWIFC